MATEEVVLPAVVKAGAQFATASGAHLSVMMKRPVTE
jgi:hypothetical protein